MTRYQVWRLVLAGFGAFAVLCLALVLASVRDNLPAGTQLPLNAPPQCEGTADTGFCFIDMSDGREYVVYNDGGKMAWFEQDWRDGNP